MPSASIRRYQLVTSVITVSWLAICKTPQAQHLPYIAFTMRRCSNDPGNGPANGSQAFALKPVSADKSQPASEYQTKAALNGQLRAAWRQNSRRQFLRCPSQSALLVNDPRGKTLGVSGRR